MAALKAESNDLRRSLSADRDRLFVCSCCASCLMLSNEHFDEIVLQAAFVLCSVMMLLHEEDIHQAFELRSPQAHR